MFLVTYNKVGISPMHIARFEKGISIPSSETIDAICEVFYVRADSPKTPQTDKNWRSFYYGTRRKMRQKGFLVILNFLTTL